MEEGFDSLHPHQLEQTEREKLHSDEVRGRDRLGDTLNIFTRRNRKVQEKRKGLKVGEGQPKIFHPLHASLNSFYEPYEKNTKRKELHRVSAVPEKDAPSLRCPLLDRADLGEGRGDTVRGAPCPAEEAPSLSPGFRDRAKQSAVRAPPRFRP